MKKSNFNTSKLLFNIIFLTMFFSFGFIMPGSAQQNKRTISLSTSGIIDIEPDTAHINSGVETVAKSAQEAVKLNSEAMAKIIKELSTQGVAKKHIQTTNFSVQPQYESYKVSSSKNRTPEIIGYRVINSVQVTIKNQKKLGAILDKLVQVGSNRINSISFSVSKSEQYLDQARQKAVSKARRRAKLYARASGVRLGKIISISEGAIYRPSSPTVRTRSYSKLESSVPVQAGSQKLQVLVNITWAIK